MNIKEKPEDSSYQLREDNDIQILYNRVMNGYSDSFPNISSAFIDDSNSNLLYAPGYEEMGIGDVVAQCK